MKYKKKKNNTGIEFITIPMWILDTFDLTMVEGAYYSFLLTFGYLTWDYEYTAKVLHISRRSVANIINKLKNKGIICIEKIEFGSRTRSIIVPLYNEEGLISTEIIEGTIKKGKDSLTKYYNDGFNSDAKIALEINKIPMQNLHYNI
jgi:hypothetical protein